MRKGKKSEDIQSACVSGLGMNQNLQEERKQVGGYKSEDIQSACVGSGNE